MAGTANAYPSHGVNGVTTLCGPTSGYSCTTGGYNGTSAQIGGGGWQPGHYWSYGSPSGSAQRHNCTTYAAYKLQRNGYGFPGWTDHARGWASRAAATGTRVDQAPAVGAIAQWNAANGLGHVAYVEVVTSTYVEITDDSFSFSGTGTTSRKRIPRGSASRPDNYIHFKDRPVGRSPIGRLDTAKGLSGGRIQVRGWSFDPDLPSRAVVVEAWIDGRRGQRGARRVSLGYATVSRPDVGRVHPRAGSRHGFLKTIAGLKPGRHVVRLYALNRFGGGGVAYLGGKTVRVPAPVPRAPGSGAGVVPPSDIFNVTGSYSPIPGDFDGDGKGDIFWYGPGAGPDSIWFGRDRGGFDQIADANVTGSYSPIPGDFDGDGKGDIFWYGPGAGPDSIWFGRDRGGFSPVQ